MTQPTNRDILDQFAVAEDHAELRGRSSAGTDHRLGEEVRECRLQVEALGRLTRRARNCSVLAALAAIASLLVTLAHVMGVTS